MSNDGHPNSRLIVRDGTRIRIALAGFGKMGYFHLLAAESLIRGEAETYYKADLPKQIRRLGICGIHDPDITKKAQCKGYLYYEYWQDLLAEQQPHLAIIAAPTDTHFDLAIQALEAGAHTLVEKPMVTSARALDALHACALQHGCRLQAGHIERYNPVAITLRTLIVDKSVDVQSYCFQRTQPLPQRISDDIITDKVVHDLDLAIYFFGPVSSARLVTGIKENGRMVEADIQITHLSGIIGTLFVSWRVADEKLKCRSVSMICNDGERIEGDFVAKSLTVGGEPVECGVQDWIAPVNNQLKDQLADFLAYCLNPSPDFPPPLLSPQEIRETICLIEELKERCQHV